MRRTLWEVGQYQVNKKTMPISIQDDVVVITTEKPLNEFINEKKAELQQVIDYNTRLQNEIAENNAKVNQLIQELEGLL